MGDKITALYCRAAKMCDIAIENQKAILLRYAEENGYSNISIFVDNGFSGLRIDDRPGLVEIRRGMKNGSIGTIIVKDFSRITRGAHPLWTFANEAESHDVALISVNNGEYNSIFGDLLACTTLQWIKASGGGMLYTGRQGKKPRKRRGQTKMTKYQKFVTELEQLSVKYGVSINAIGGVSIWEDGELESIEYTKDETSGDIYPRTINGEKY
jgi:hypothetical protein